ncbi:hypothetical protein [Chthonobacter rhizosphaerae]|uniref:hypothetical protein n=1 Tax=Chthonobacter rhizosphaerae TaxID=2735553 RepID=UPI0015EED241|nr:hypothetical protein [Chthonobacter rhizosphaerae]
MDVQKIIASAAGQAPGFLSSNYSQFVGGSSTAMRVALGVTLALAVVGWSLAVSRGSDIATYESQLAEAGLVGIEPDRLTATLAERRRDLNRVESALVARAAALAAREQHLAKAVAAQERAETIAADAAKAKAAADQAIVTAAIEKQGLDRTIIRSENALVSLTAAVGAREKQLAALSAKANAQSRELDELRRFQASMNQYLAERETLKRDTIRTENRLVSLEAAAGFRDRQLGTLITKVNAASDRLREADLWAANKDRMLAETAEIAREVTRTENRLVSTAAAANARQGQVDKAATRLAAIETEAEALNRAILSSESQKKALGAEIVALDGEAAAKSRDLVRVNNQLVPLIAAVGAREQQIAKLTARSSALEADAMELTRKMAIEDRRLDEMTETATIAAERLKALSDFLSTQATPVATQ